MRELGEGMKRIFELMSENELQKPVLYSNGLWFSVTLNNKTIYSNKEQEWLGMFEKYALNNNQKKIVLLGMDDKEISPADIENALNTVDLLTYNTEVTELRTKGLLKEIRNTIQAKNLARKRGLAKRQIASFKVSLDS
jgi:ATP-dependent DNA helicase RecG